MTKFKKSCLYENFSDDIFDGSIQNEPSAHRIQTRHNDDCMSSDDYQYKIGIELKRIQYNHEIYEFTPQFEQFRDNVFQILDANRKISNFFIYDQIFTAYPSNIQKLSTERPGATNQYLYFAFNADFSHFRDVEKFFYQLSVAAQRHKQLFMRKFQTDSNIRPEMNVMKVRYEFFVSVDYAWKQLGGNELWPYSMLRKLHDHDIHRYDGKTLALLILFSQVFLQDERDLPDFWISPSSYTNVEESLFAMSRHFIKDQRLRSRIIFDENNEITGNMIDAEYITAHLDEFYMCYWGPREYTDSAKQTLMKVKFESVPMRTLKYECGSLYGTVDHNYRLVDYMRHHQMRVNGCVYVRKVAKTFVKKETPEFDAMIFLHVSFGLYVRNLVACDMILTIPSKTEIPSVNKLKQRMLLPLESVCKTDINNTEFYRAILEDAYGAGLSD